MRRITVWGIGLCIAAASVLTPSGAEAQYFGRNKVQYRDFKFEVLKTEHFDIYFYAEERDAASEVGRLAERWYARLSVLLNHTLTNRQPVVLYQSHADFEQTNVVGGEIGEGTGGVTEGLKRRVVLPLTGALKETDHVLGHELVHAFQYDIARQDAEQPGGSSIDRLPLWFVEGMAEYLSLGPVDPHTAMWVRDAVRHESLPEIKKLGDPKYFPYRWGQTLWSYIGGRFGDRMIGRVFTDALREGPDEAIARVLGQKTKDLSAGWHTAIREQYAQILDATKRPGAFGRPLLAEEGKDLPFYASPSLSPDGKRIVVYSERGLLSVDMYLADVETGRVIRKLVSTAIDPHYTSLQFINSAGSWRPDGREFVVGAVRSGHPVLAILNVDNGKTVREKAFPELGEILNPAWSPNGQTIVFSAMAGGYSDLYAYDLKADTVRRLTNDRFADLQPAWSPDGSRIAFVTDRFTTKLPVLAAGAYSLALLDPESGAIERIQTFDEAKSINPQWSGDGSSLYFIADPFGVSNIFAFDLASRSVRQITNLDTGVSGITDISPAISVAATGRPRVAFSVHDDRHPTVYVAEDATVLAGSRPARTWGDLAANVLPPERRASPDLVAALNDPQKGLPADTTETTEDYKPKLSLDAVGQPYVGAGFSSFGPSVGGGISFLWSDALGNHNLAAVVNANTYGGRFSNILKDSGGMIAYQNLTHKWDWGVSIEQSPYLAAGFSSGFGTVGGQPVFVEQDIIYRQVFRSVNGMVARPLTPTHRVEFGASYQRVLFEQEVRTLTASPQTGSLLSDTTETTQLGDPLGLTSGSAAFVVDSAVFGATSPVAGQRSRFEIAPTFGSVQFTSALADYRKYFMPASFYTIAGRVLHYGRYGSGGEDTRLIPLFIGYPQLIRGYDIGSLSAEECTSSVNGSCPAFDRLVGSRMLVGNLEFRFPLLRPFGATGRMYGPVPTEVAFFADGGAAWNRGEKPSFLGGSRESVASAGVSLRVSLFGFAVGQFDFAHPFQRPSRNWVWSFSLTPGF